MPAGRARECGELLRTLGRGVHPHPAPPYPSLPTATLSWPSASFPLSAPVMTLSLILSRDVLAPVSPSWLALDLNLTQDRVVVLCLFVGGS